MLTPYLQMFQNIKGQGLSQHPLVPRQPVDQDVRKGARAQDKEQENTYDDREHAHGGRLLCDRAARRLELRLPTFDAPILADSSQESHRVVFRVRYGSVRARQGFPDPTRATTRMTPA